MKSINCTLVADGSSDGILQFPIKWLLEQKLPEHAINLVFADLRNYSGARSLSHRIELACELFPCDVLFVHRDAEKQSISKRESEIIAALSGNSSIGIPIVPIRMSEAWLLLSVSSIRQASGNPNGRERVHLPPISQLESQPDPKSLLIGLIKQASGLNKRRQSSLNPRTVIHRLAELIEDYSALRQLSAFNVFEAKVDEVLPHLQ